MCISLCSIVEHNKANNNTENLALIFHTVTIVQVLSNESKGL